MRWGNSWFNLLKSHLGDGLFSFEWIKEILLICWKATWEMVCFCSERQVAEWQYIVVHTIFAFVSQFSAFFHSFFLLISTLSSVCLYLAVFSISAFWSVFTFSSAFPCWTFLTQFTIALLYHIKSFHYCWHMSTMPQFKVIIALIVCGSSECLCKTVRTAWSKVPLRIDQILTISSDALKLAKSTETTKVETSFCIIEIHTQIQADLWTSEVGRFDPSLPPAESPLEGI